MHRFPRPLLLAVALVVAALSFAGCNVPTPLAQAEPIGEVPKWGDGFATPTEAPASMLGNGMGNTGLPAGTKSPGDTGSWSGGDAALGKGIFTAMCARCHGDNGEGGAIPGGARATALSDAKWQASVEDRQIARAVMLGKGAMPSFMKEGLDKPKLMGIVAYIRTLKK